MSKKKFRVRISEPEWHSYLWSVKAKDEEEAIELAMNGEGNVIHEGCICLVENTDREIDSVVEIRNKKD